MKLFAVIRVPGANWNPQRALREQDGWTPHAQFMDDLAERGTILLGGPLEDGSVLLIVRANDEASVHAALEPDPWHAAGLLEIVSVRRWTVLLGRSEFKDWQ